MEASDLTSYLSSLTPAQRLILLTSGGAGIGALAGSLYKGKTGAVLGSILGSAGGLAVDSQLNTGAPLTKISNMRKRYFKTGVEALQDLIANVPSFT